MAVIRRRAKSAVKKRHKKTIKLSTVDKVWKEYVEYAIIRQVIYRGVADIEGHFKVELTGQPYSEQMLKRMEKGYIVGKWGLKKVEKLNRFGYHYKLSLTDKNCKSKIVFNADPKFKKRVHEQLKNTNQYYKII